MIEQISVFIGLGSNLEDRLSQINKALELLSFKNYLNFRSISSYYETEPVGVEPQPAYLNAVAEFSCSISPEKLLDFILSIEEKMGRIRIFKGSPRLIDIDILLYGSNVLKTTSLEIPHPRMHERRFVLLPLSEIAPKVFHPILEKTVDELLESVVEDIFWVKKIDSDSGLYL